MKKNKETIKKIAIVTGRLEVRLNDDSEARKEVLKLQEEILKPVINSVQLAISVGRLTEKVAAEEEVTSQKELEELSKLIMDYDSSIPISDLRFSVGVCNTLTRYYRSRNGEGEMTLEDLSEMTVEDLKKMRNMTPKKLEEILETLKELGIVLEESHK